jgi:hypothetical protein
LLLVLVAPLVQEVKVPLELVVMVQILVFTAQVPFLFQHYGLPVAVVVDSVVEVHLVVWVCLVALVVVVLVWLQVGRSLEDWVLRVRVLLVVLDFI